MTCLDWIYNGLVFLQAEVAEGDIINPTEQALLGVMMAIIMLGMGASMTFKDFRLALRNPKGVGIGFFSQYLFMPVIAFLIALILNLPPLVAAGLILMGCVPGGTTSNIFAYFSKSMLSLSILMTVASTLFAVLMVPVVFSFYTSVLAGTAPAWAALVVISLLATMIVLAVAAQFARRYSSRAGIVLEVAAVGMVLAALASMVTFFLIGLGSPDVEGEWREAQIPPRDIAAVLGVLLVPTLIGMWTRRKNANVGAMFELIGAVMGVLVIAFLIITWVPRNWRFLMEARPEIYAAAILLGLFGFLVGYWFARGWRMDKVKARTVSLETGIQNGPLAALIILFSIAEAAQRDMLTIPVLYMLFIVMTSTVITFFYRARSTREELARDQAKVEVDAGAGTGTKAS